jgi:small subunit ribosomal protein S20
MAHHKSAQKRIRQTERRTLVNRARVSRIRTFIKRVEKAIEAGDKTLAQQALHQAQPEIMRGVSKGVIKLGTASRKVSRLSARVKALGAAAA